MGFVMGEATGTSELSKPFMGLMSTLADIFQLERVQRLLRHWLGCNNNPLSEEEMVELLEWVDSILGVLKDTPSWLAGTPQSSHKPVEGPKDAKWVGIKLAGSHCGLPSSITITQAIKNGVGPRFDTIRRGKRIQKRFRPEWLDEWVVRGMPTILLKRKRRKWRKR